MTQAAHLPASGQDAGPDAEARFRRVWAVPPGWRSWTEVNNSVIGARFVLTGFIFFLLAGLMALAMRTQLITPDNDLMSAELYNQLFTMHGTVMMFVVAVPIMEAFGAYLIPGMLGARDLAFPRLSQYAYYCYVLGGLLLFSSFAFGAVPDGGWFMYAPLTGPEFSPGKGQDFWLLGVTFLEIASIASAVELIVTILGARAPGMSLDRMPIFAWYMLAVAFMIVFAFPPLVVASLMLEAERAFGLPFFDPDRGGDPLLWQHLFWIFGHPEVYIIFLPGAGLVSAMLPAIARVRLVAYHWLVLAVVGTAFLSFGLWVHHMYATGLPVLALSFFAGASMAVAIPSGVQVFSWIATLWVGKPVVRVPLLYIIGFVVIFVLGGLTGVMVAVVPFDWQVHDSYFVVAHFHYVLIGSMLFPLLGALHFYAPRRTGRMLSETLGRWAFWLIFIGFNATFLIMHYTGLMGMPRRVFTYPEGSGWAVPNLVSTLGSYVIGAGVLLFAINLVLSRHRGRPAGVNPWDAGTLEWANDTPTPDFNIRSIPRIAGRDPLWDQQGLMERIRAGDEYLGRADEGRREMLATTAVDARPDHVARLAHPTILPALTAFATAAVFIGALAGVWLLSATGLAAFLALVLVWAWEPEPEAEEKDVGCGLRLPIQVGDFRAHRWRGALCFQLVDAAAFLALVYSHLYLWTGGGARPLDGLAPDLDGPAFACLALTLTAALGGGLAMAGAIRGAAATAVAGLGLLAATGVLAPAAATLAWRGTPFTATVEALSATTLALGLSPALHAAVVAVMALYALARILRHGLRPHRSLSTRVAALFAFVLSAQGLIAVVLIYGLPGAG